MMHILKIEWLKLKKYRAFLAVLILMVVGIFGINYIVYGFTRTVDDMASSDPMTAAAGNILIGQGPFAFPQVFHTVSYISGFLHILPGLLMILLISNEYGYRTNRQGVINGLKRQDLFTGKVLLMAILAVGTTLLMFLTACLFGWISGGAGFSIGNMEYIGYFFVQSLSYMSIAMVIAILSKRAGIGIVVYVVYAFIIENILTITANKLLYPGSGYFLPLKSADKLIDTPTIIGKAFSSNIPEAAYLLIAAVLWISVCLWFCSYKFKKSDL